MGQEFDFNLHSLISPDPGPSSTDSEQHVSLWSLLNQSPSGSLLVFDGSYDPNFGDVASACVLLNQSRSIQNGIAKRFPASLALISEALAARDACLLGAARGL